MNKQNITGFHLLKILAATFIVFHHYQQVFKVKFSGINFYDGVFNFGYLVELFFLISGFLTFYVNKSGGGIRKNLMHKLLRIYPMSIIACAATLIIKSIRSTDLKTLWNMKALVANLFLVFSGWPFFSMTGYNNPTWYLCILIQCYLIFYIWEWMGKKRYQIVGLICFVILLHRFGLFPGSSFRGIETFFIGVVLCDIKDVIPEKKRTATIITILAALLIMIFPSQQRRILVFLAFPSLVMLCAWWRCHNDKLVNVLEVLGKITFEVYLWHYPLMAVVQMVMRVTGIEVIHHTYFSMIGFAVVVWLFSYLMFRWVEIPIGRLIKRGTQWKGKTLQ